MARRRKTSPAEDLTDLVAILPRWASVVLALIAYLWLHHVASAPIAAATQLEQMGGMVTQHLWQSRGTRPIDAGPR